MCGFKGVVTRLNDQCSYINLEECGYYSTSLHNRGPSDRSLLTFDNCLFDHYRLAIRNVHADSSKQPKESDKFIFGFNGEIYSEESNQLKRITDRSDTSFLWNRLHHLGPNALFDSLIGEYAYFIYDKKKQELHLGVDHNSVKPLYYTASSAGIFFSSSIVDCHLISHRASSTENLSIDIDQIGEYLLFRCFANDRTGFKHILKLEPGCHLVFNRLNGVITKTYHKRPLVPIVQNSNPDEINNIVTSLLDVYTQSDFPISLCLSGGLDSSYILYTLKNLGINPISYSIYQSIDDPDFQACSVIKQDLSDLQLKLIPGNNSKTWSLQNFIETASLFNGMLHLPNAIMLQKLFEVACQNGPVILSGEGADEALGSYNRYQHLPKVIYNRYFGSKSLDEDSLNSPFENWPNRRYGMMEEICLSASFSSRNIALQAIEHFNFSTSLTERMTNLESRISSSHPKDIDGIKKAMKDSDKNSYLPAMLRRQDILSMNSSIECRVPFASTIFQDLSSSFVENKRLGFSPKYMIQKCCQLLSVPPSIVKRRKHGFPPMTTHYNRFLDSPEVESYISSCSLTKQLYDYAIHQFNTQNMYSQIQDFKFSLLCLAVGLTEPSS